MRIVALLAIRNERLYLARCLAHLHAQGVETCVIDNDSDDGSLEIANSFRDRGVFRIERYAFDGIFDLRGMLRHKEQLAHEIEADWFIHHDADEIREAPLPYRSLREGLEAADRAGYNAVNFDEYVFVPTAGDENHEDRDFVETMRYYYFLEPRPLRRINAWKNTGVQVDLASKGGHHIGFENRRVFPTPFILRHYIVLSRRHAIEKYGRRVFALEEIRGGGWHRERLGFTPEQLHFPVRDKLKELGAVGCWDKSDPWRRHEFMVSTRAVT
jgi:glycosyltransferase involved in cell wall biosynthesis